MTKPQSFPVLLQLPPKQLENVFEVRGILRILFSICKIVFCENISLMKAVIIDARQSSEYASVSYGAETQAFVQSCTRE